MKLSDIITRIQELSGLGNWDGNAIDQNRMAYTIAVFHDTLNDINNDPALTLVQKELDYQTYTEDEKSPEMPFVEAASWLTPPIFDTPSELPKEPPLSLFPDADVLPFPVAIEYPLPSDCRRVLRARHGIVELRKTDFGEISMMRRQAGGFLNMFAINDGKLCLIRPVPIMIVYVKEFKDFLPQDDVDLPKEALSYVINVCAYNIALTYNESAAARCRVMAEKSYNSLLANLRVNSGDIYIDPNLAINRYTRRWRSVGL